MSHTATTESTPPRSSPSIYPSLTAWIESHGGFIHPSLTLLHNDENGYRGISTEADISKGELLIRIPASITIGGDRLPPSSVTDPASNVPAPSPWLRCLASLMETSRSSPVSASNSDPDWKGWNDPDATFGLEMQYPWSALLLSGKKTVETRAYALPLSLVGKKLYVLESSLGTAGVSSLGDFTLEGAEGKGVKKRGWVIFSGAVRYSDRMSFEGDEEKHLVERDSGYGWKEDTGVIYGWIVGETGGYDEGGHAQSRVVGWKRRMRSFFQMESKDDVDFTPYLSSLPSSFETLYSWSLDELRDNLCGTALGHMALTDREQQLFQKQYQKRVKPFLETLEATSSSTWEHFLWSAQCISTRGFHFHQEAASTSHSYPGPFLLPFIDLLNHHKTNKCTTLSRDPTSLAFYMVAERDIVAQEEITHSYGATLSSGQLLQTFGFVPTENMRTAAASCTDATEIAEITCGVLSQQMLICACLEVCTSPQVTALRETILADGGDDEDAWDASSAWDAKVAFLSKNSPSLPQDILISTDKETIGVLLTCCTVLFLPNEDSIDELFQNDEFYTFDESVVFQDDYMGRLVCMGILRAIETKFESYGGNTHLKQNGQLILAWLEGGDNADATRRKMEGLTIQIEEKIGLEQLRKKVMGWLQLLDKGIEDHDDNEQY